MDLHALRYRHDIIELEARELTSRTIRFAVKSPYERLFDYAWRC